MGERPRYRMMRKLTERYHLNKRPLRVLFLVVSMLLVMLIALSCSDVIIDRKNAMEKAKDYIRDNFDGLTPVNLDSGSIEKEDGIWKIPLECEQENVEGESKDAEQKTLILFVDDKDGEVWGSTIDGW